jgi:DNA-binding NtrC family response regulator
VDARVVAATNSDLEGAVDEGTFREDLYARLMGALLRVLPLRQRREDVLVLARHFLASQGKEVDLSADAAEALLVHPWRFNVRELEQMMRVAGRAAREAGCLDVDHLPEPVREPFQARAVSILPEPPHASPLLRISRDAKPSPAELEQLLRHFEGNVARVAAFFGKDRRQIYRWASRGGIDLDAFRDEGEDSGD